jgi:hypothetical protein
VKTAGRKVNRAIDKVGAKVSEARRKSRSAKARPAPRAKPARTRRTTTKTETIERY